MLYRIVDYDIYKYDGTWTVNNAMYTNFTIDIKEKDSDVEIFKKMKEVGFLSSGAKFKNLNIDGEFGYSFYVDHETSRDSKPFCELRPE
jgi:hypothetical protein